jgi:hypothetical protein
MISELDAMDGKDLIIVSYAPNHRMHEEWVYNGAEPDAGSIVWARDMGWQRNIEIIEYYADRHIWSLFADETPPRLDPYKGLPQLAK